MIVVRPAEGEADYHIIFALLLVQHAEVGRAQVNPRKSGIYIYRVMTEGAAYVIERDGQPIGSIGLSVVPFWYSDEKFWSEEWLFIVPAHRDGAALRAVMTELKVLGEQTSLPVSLVVFNEKRKKSTGIARIAEQFFFVPAGINVKVNSESGG